MLCGVVFRELFDFRLMQTDPNFANYLYRPDDGRIVLLDFGSTVRFEEAFTERYREICRALIDDERAAEYVPAQEIHTRFGDLERRLSAMERETSETYLPADDIRALFAETEQRLREIERLALERVTRLGADSCGD